MIAISSFVTKLEEHEKSTVSSNKTSNLPEVAEHEKSLWHFLWAHEEKAKLIQINLHLKHHLSAGFEQQMDGEQEHRELPERSHTVSHHLGIVVPRKRRDPLPATGWPVPRGGKIPAGSSARTQ